MNYWWDGVSTAQQDLTAQRDGLHALGVGDLRRPRLDGREPRSTRVRLALAACRAGDTLVVTKLDRLARSLPDARDIRLWSPRTGDILREPLDGGAVARVVGGIGTRVRNSTGLRAPDLVLPISRSLVVKR